jgi:Ca-activated chloride channel family protein
VVALGEPGKSPGSLYILQQPKGRNSMRRLNPVTVAIWFPICLLNGQTEYRDYKIVSDVKLVLLDVAVRDSDGAFSSGLQRENFHVFDSGKEQPVSVFSGEDTPVTVGILVDHSGSMRTKRDDVANAALALISESNPNDEVFVVSFGDSVLFDLPPGVAFSGNRDQLRTALGKEKSQGRTSLYDAIGAGLNHLAKGTRDRKTLVLISDGGDTASHTTAGEVMQMAKSAGATIHSVGIYDENDHDLDLGFLKRLARMTGGEVVIEEKKTNIIATCRQIAKDIRSRYTIGFQPPPVKGPQTRKIRVAVTAPGYGKLSAWTRQQYVIPAPGERTP